jgi:hypothetical protein
MVEVTPTYENEFARLCCRRRIAGESRSERMLVGGTVRRLAGLSSVHNNTFLNRSSRDIRVIYSILKMKCSSQDF